MMHSLHHFTSLAQIFFLDNEIKENAKRLILSNINVGVSLDSTFVLFVGPRFTNWFSDLGQSCYIRHF